MKYLHALIIVISIPGAAAAERQSSYAPAYTQDGAYSHVLALDTDNRDSRSRREIVNTQLPLTSPDQQGDETCMMVCSSWGEECVMFHSGTVRATRKCVRTCESFSEECL